MWTLEVELEVVSERLINQANRVVKTFLVRKFFVKTYIMINIFFITSKLIKQCQYIIVKIDVKYIDNSQKDYIL